MTVTVTVTVTVAVDVDVDVDVGAPVMSRDPVDSWPVCPEAEQKEAPGAVR